MEEKHKLAEEINIAQSLQLLATAYEEISIMKMRLARDSVIHTRNFLSSLSDVFVNVKNSYAKKLLAQQEKDKQDPKVLQFATHKTNGKEVFVLLSAASKLYGDIIYKTFELFKNYMKDNVDIVIVGRTGRELFTKLYPGHPYTFFDLPDVIPTMETLKPLITFIVEYEHVNVFYGRFVNVVTQEAAQSSISGDETLLKETQQRKTTSEEYEFLFEPSIDELMGFFETQIFSSLFKQTIAEEELARLASRIKAMEQATVFINSRISLLLMSEKRVKKHIENQKQQERLAGMKMWGRKR